MSNMPDVNRRQIGLRIPRELYYRIAQEADNHRMPMADYIRHVLHETFDGVPLSAESLAKIAQEIKEAQDARNHAR